MNQNGTQSGRDARCSSRADIALPAERRDLNPSGVVSAVFVNIVVRFLMRPERGPSLGFGYVPSVG